MAALTENGRWQPKIKLSNSRSKITLPGKKQTYRLFHPHSKTAFADVITLADEELTAPLTVTNVDPLSTFSQLTLTDFVAQPLQVPVVSKDAQPVETDVLAIQERTQKQLAQLPAATKRLVNPDAYPVYLSPKLAALQQELMKEHQQ